MDGARGSLMQLAFSALAWSVYQVFLRYLPPLETEGALLLHSKSQGEVAQQRVLGPFLCPESLRP